MTTTLTVAMATHLGDKSLAVQLLKWIGALGCCKSRTLVLIMDESEQLRMIPVAELAGNAFRTVETVLLKPSPWGKEWPRGANWAFMHAADHLKGRAFLWMEPDSFPTRKNWLAQLEEEYNAAKKPFMGTMYESKEANMPPKMMLGVGIYPPNTSEIVKTDIIKSWWQPWDTLCAGKIVQDAHNTALIQHFPKTPTGYVKLTKLGVIRADAVLFHGDKYGNLCRQLSLRKALSAPAPAAQRVPATRKEMPTMSSRCVVQLGRIGDILNVLPIVKHLSSSNRHLRVPMVVHASMVSALQRVSYADLGVWDGSMDDPKAAAAKVSENYSKVLVAQLFSKEGLASPFHESYNHDQYRACGYDNLFHASMLEIDRRNYTEERAWLQSCEICGPFVAVNLSGISSPFKHANLILDAIKEVLPSHQILDLNAHQAKCFTDQISALETCDALVTVDTATLHLANASSCRTLAFISEHDGSKWFGTKPLRPVFWSSRYPDVEARIGDFKNALMLATSMRRKLGKTYHVVNRRLTDNPRVAHAVSEWAKLYESGIMIPRQVWRTDRTAKSKGDRRDLPYLRDVLASAIEGMDDSDVVLFTNDDVVFDAKLVEHARLKLANVNLVTASRIDVESPTVPSFFRHAGRDAFAATVGWIRGNLHLMPDFVLGASEWDLVLCAMARNMIGVNTTSDNVWHNCGGCEIPVGLLRHVKHEETWQRKDNEKSWSQKHNRTLAEEWMRKNAPTLKMAWFNRV